MPYTVPTYSQIRDRYLQAIVNLQPAAAIGPDSDHFVRASGIAAVLEALYAHQAWGFRQAFPDLADADFMEKMANQRGLTRKAAVQAGGTVRVSGTVGAAVAAGLQVFTAQGVYFEITASGVIGGGGTVDLAAQALLAGIAGNQPNSTPVTFAAPTAGLLAAATLLTMTGGSDIEADDALLERLLLWLSEEAQGGNKVDYERWALGVPGVARAFVFDTRRGFATVDVVPMPASGLPSAPLLAAVQAVLDVKRPVGMSNITPVLALAPTAVPTDVAAALTLAAGYTLGSLNAALTAAVNDVFTKLAPGGTLIRAELIAALMNVEGVTDVTLTLPAANVTSLVNSTNLQLVTLGTLTLS
jgi:uncharacterized phage protein gp47/JayE